jgi:RHS repeat-associated protein
LELSASGVLNPETITYYASHNTADSVTKPKAFLNWVLFDEQFKYVSSSSGFEQVGSDQEFKVHTPGNMLVNKNGYLYIYVSNETPNISVFFDNLQVTHIKGPLLEETSYYPFGLTMAGISTKAAKYGPENSKKFNDGTELTNDLKLQWYETTWRTFDPQLGRFFQIDPLADDFCEWSPFAFAVNNPILVNDPTGLDSLTRKTNLDPVYVTAKRNQGRGIPYLQNLAKKDPMAAASQGYGYAYSLPSNRWSGQMQFTPAELERGGLIARNVLFFVIPWGRVVKGVAWVYRASKARQVARAIQLAKLSELTAAEVKIVEEANIILNSPQLQVLRNAYLTSTPVEVVVGGRSIIYSSDMAASGVSLFGENGFVIGKEAFASKAELGKTILHELYRLANSGYSAIKGSGTVQAMITEETQAAFNFAEKATGLLKF